MLLAECEKSGVTLFKEKIVSNIFKNENSYSIDLGDTSYTSSSLVVSTGGLSVPKIGATKFGYDIAKKFGLEIINPSAALVPLTFSDNILKMCKELTGISQDAIVSYGKTFFKEGMLFTHRGLSGPSILQISSYWKLTNEIDINLCPSLNVYKFLEDKKKYNFKIFIVGLKISNKSLFKKLYKNIFFISKASSLPKKNTKICITIADPKKRKYFYDLLKKFKLNNKKVAIEHNGAIVPKGNYKKKIFKKQR